jgi:hypothetical protein
MRVQHGCRAGACLDGVAHGHGLRAAVDKVLDLLLEALVELAREHLCVGGWGGWGGWGGTRRVRPGAAGVGKGAAGWAQTLAGGQVKSLMTSWKASSMATTRALEPVMTPSAICTRLKGRWGWD